PKRSSDSSADSSVSINVYLPANCVAGLLRALKVMRSPSMPTEELLRNRAKTLSISEGPFKDKDIETTKKSFAPVRIVDEPVPSANKRPLNEYLLEPRRSDPL